MRILDLDMDYFMKTVVNFRAEFESERLPDDEFGAYVWSESEIRSFLENNLGLSKESRIKGRVVRGHNESLFFWKELITSNKLNPGFEVIHVDSHADLGLGYHSWIHIMNNLLSYQVNERPLHSEYYDGRFKKNIKEGIGDYLLFAIAYRWISKLTYCGNPYADCGDYIKYILKGFKDANTLNNKAPVKNTIQLFYNSDPEADFTRCYDDSLKLFKFMKNCIFEPEVPFYIIPTVEDVKFDGDYDYAILAQSPSFTPPKADFIMDIFREYIIEK